MKKYGTILAILLLASTAFGGTTTNFAWDYGTEGQDPWWSTWVNIFTGIDTSLYTIDTALGLAAGATHFGTFTGSTIADSSTGKAALQSLETALELKSPTASPTFTTSVGLPATLTSAAAVTWTLMDDQASALSLGATGAADILKIFTTNAGPGISIGGKLSATTYGSDGSITDAELLYIGGLTSDAQAQINLKSPIASPTFTGLVTLPTGTNLVAPLKFVSGTVLATPIAGTMEFDTDTLSFTITTGPARKTIAFTTSNVATATALAADPADCGAGTIATGINASGTLSCTGTPSGLTSVGATTFTGALTGNASTASALAANGANCNAGYYPLGVDAAGAVETCTEAPTAALLHVDDILTALGIASTETHFGTFTGSTIADSSTAKSALQALETSLEGMVTSIGDCLTGACLGSGSTATIEAGGLTLNATLGSELSPALTGASTVNWTFAGTYTTPLNSTIEKAGDGTDTITPTAATTIVAGVTYKVVITTSACTVGGFSYTLGGVSGTSFSTATTVTDYITATTTGKLIITPTATSSRFVISSISFKALTDATGDLTVNGNLIAQSPSTFNSKITLNRGQLLLPDGTAGAPSLIFTSSPTMGIYASASYNMAFAYGGGDSVVLDFANKRIVLYNDFYMDWNSDVRLYRDAANTLALRNAASQQKFSIYNTWTSATSYERLALTGVAGTSLNITAETADAGADNLDIILAPAGTGSVKVSSEFNGATVSNQFSNRLAGDLLGISTAPKILNTLLGTPSTDAANMIDVSGAGHNGTYKGTWASSQRINKGMGWVLNPNATDNYIDLGDSDDFSFSTGDLTDIAFTIAGVIEVVNTATNQMIFSKFDTTTGSTKREYNLYLGTDETLTMQFYDESVSIQINRITNAALSVGFHSFTITYDGGGGATAANGITIYVDGAVVASTATNNASYVAMENTTTSFWIGSRKSTGGTPEYFMQGDFTPPLIDKGYVWSAATVNRFHQYMKGIFNL